MSCRDALVWPSCVVSNQLGTGLSHGALWFLEAPAFRLTAGLMASPAAQELPNQPRAERVDDAVRSSVGNLRWGTPAENAADAKRNGRRRQH
jgi:hypothetical protein